MCSLIHPLDPLSTSSYCTSTIHLRELFNNTWPLPFRHTVTNWIPTAPRGEVHNYFKTLVPNSLSNRLRTPHRNTTYAHHINSLTKALQHRRKPLSKALESIREWFITNPLNLDHLEPHAPNNPWFTPMSDLSTSSSSNKTYLSNETTTQQTHQQTPLPNSLLSQNKTFIKIPPLERHTPQLPQHNIFSLNFFSAFHLHHFSPPLSKTSRLCSKRTQAEPPPPQQDA